MVTAPPRPVTRVFGSRGEPMARDVGLRSSGASAPPWRVIRAPQDDRVFFRFDGRCELEDWEKIVGTLTGRLGGQQIDEIHAPYGVLLVFLARGAFLVVTTDAAGEIYFKGELADDPPAIEFLAGEWAAALNEAYPDG
jgi:hypothetical protein